MPLKMWFVPHSLTKEVSKFSKWIPSGGITLPTTTPSMKSKSFVTPSAPPAPLLPSPELLAALGSKRDYTLITPPSNSNSISTESNIVVESAPIPSFLLYKLKEKTTADLAKILVALGVKLPLGLDVDELIEIMKENPNAIHIDNSPPPPVTFKPIKEFTEHELIMQKIKAQKEAEERARKQKEKGEEILPSAGTGYVAPAKKRARIIAEKEEKEMSKEHRELLARIEDDDYSTIR